MADYNSTHTGAEIDAAVTIANTLAPWAKTSSKPTYTAQEVGALPSDTPIPDEYELPQASATALGGVKADTATEADTQAVRIGADGKLYIAPGAGVSVTSASIDASGHLIVGLSNDTTIDAGLVKGEDGISPTATVTKDGSNATITITDKNGTTSAVISDGSGSSGGSGQDGYSPIASVTKSGKVATITITDKTGTTTATVSDGNDGEPGAKGDTGATGAAGQDGATFTPAVDEDGNLSWTNDGGLSNPATVNIKGPAGAAAVTSDSGWQLLTLESEINVHESTFAITPQYRKIGNHVFVKGHINCAVPSGGRLIAVLPEGFRPPSGTHYDIAECAGSRVARIYADSAGNLKCEWVYTIGGSAYTSALWIQIDIDYLVD